LKCARRRRFCNDRGEGGVTLRGVEDPGRGGEDLDADFDRDVRISFQVAEPAGIPRGAAVRRDDEIATGTPVVGERRRALLAASRVGRRQQKKRRVCELAADNAAVRSELIDH
jgi:hypothetical protein